MTEVEAHNGTSYSTQATMNYNGLGQRLGMDASGVIAYYVMDGNRPLTATTGTDTTSYLYGLGAIGEKTTTWSYALLDGTNTQRQLTNSTGEITYSAKYTPWGDTLESSGTGNFTFGYFGSLMDNATGLMYVGEGQYYDPETGRFLTRNPNANGNPYLPFDPTGAMLGPLGVLAVLLGRKKKKSKYDVLLFVLAFAILSGMALTACIPTPTPGDNGTPVPTTPVPGTPPLPRETGNGTPIPSDPGVPVIIPTPCPTPTPAPIPININDYITFTGWTEDQKAVAMKAIRKVNEKLLGDATLLKFFQVYNISTTPSTRLQFIKKSDAGQNGCAAGPNLIKCHPTYNFEDPRLIVHELGHLLHQNNPSRNLYGDIRISENAIVDDLGRWVTGLHPRGDECRDNEDPNSSLGIRCTATTVDQYGSFERTFRGYTGDSIPHVYHGTSFPDWRTNLNEDYAHMFMNWTYNTFNDDASAYNAGTKRYEWMEQRMSQFIG